MARCRSCDRRMSGFLLDDRDMCTPCGAKLDGLIRGASRVIGESIEIIETSKNLETRLSRCDVVVEHAERLLPYEKRGIPTLRTPPTEIIREIEDARRKLLEMDDSTTGGAP